MSHCLLPFCFPGWKQHEIYVSGNNMWLICMVFTNRQERSLPPSVSFLIPWMILQIDMQHSWGLQKCLNR